MLGDAVEIAEAAHEGVPQAAEVCTVLHLLGEDVTGIDFSGDVEDVDCTVLDPFSGAVLAEFEMATFFMVVVLAQMTAAALSLYTMVGSALSRSGLPAKSNPSARLRTPTVILAPSLVAKILASQELRDVWS